MASNICCFIYYNYVLLLLATYCLLCSKFGIHCREQICPQECLCYSHEEAFCLFGKEISAIMQTLPIEIQRLTINGGNISELKNQDLIRYRNLRELKMFSNSLTRILPYAFANLTNLRKIYVEKNALTELEPYSLAGLKNLDEIFLTRNRIRRIRKFVFDRTSSIKTIDLRNNPTETLETGAFSNLNTVGTLHLPANITNIEANAFENLTNVDFLDVHGLKVQYIGPDTFRNMGPIRSMSIRDSDLGLIKSNAFAEMASNGIESMAIENCRIKRIRKLSFANAKIGNLEFKRNDIARLENGALGTKAGQTFWHNKIDCRKCENVFWILNNDVKPLITNTMCLPVLESSDDKEKFVYERRDEFYENCDPTSLSDEDYDENFGNAGGDIRIQKSVLPISLSFIAFVVWTLMSDNIC